MTDPNNDRIIKDHILGMRGEVCAVMDTIFAEISNPDRIAGATYPQLVQAMQMLMKGFADEEQAETSGRGELARILGNYFDEVI